MFFGSRARVDQPLDRQNQISSRMIQATWEYADTVSRPYREMSLWEEWNTREGDQITRDSRMKPSLLAWKPGSRGDTSRTLVCVIDSTPVERDAREEISS